MSSGFRSLCSIAILIMALCKMGSTQEVNPSVNSATIKSLDRQLPSCSELHHFLSGIDEPVDQPYMPLMRQEGIRRITLVIDAVLHHHKMSDIHITRRLYFRQYDDSSSQITDSDRLKNFADSEMERLIEQPLLVRAASMGFHRIDSGPKGKEGERGRAVVNIFDNALIGRGDPFFLRIPKSNNPDLSGAASSGDSQEVKRMVANANLPSGDLNQALPLAVSYSFDNSVIIETLLHAGADINAHDRFGLPLLDDPTASPCSLQTLLRDGANPTERDKRGETPLQRAKEQNRVGAIRIFEDALSKQ